MLTIGKSRGLLYWLAKVLGDVNAVRRNKVGQRIARRLAGRLTGRFLFGKFFR